MNAPDSLTIPDAVKALVEYFAPCGVSVTDDGGEIRFIPGGSWTVAIRNGFYSPAAVKVGLEDLFVSILMDAKESEK